MRTEKNISGGYYIKTFTLFLFSLSIICFGLCFNYKIAYAGTLKADESRVENSSDNNYTLTLIERGNKKEKIKY